MANIYATQPHSDSPGKFMTDVHEFTFSSILRYLCGKQSQRGRGTGFFFNPVYFSPAQEGFHFFFNSHSLGTWREIARAMSTFERRGNIRAWFYSTSGGKGAK